RARVQVHVNRPVSRVADFNSETHAGDRSACEARIRKCVLVVGGVSAATSRTGDGASRGNGRAIPAVQGVVAAIDDWTAGLRLIGAGLLLMPLPADCGTVSEPAHAALVMQNAAAGSHRQAATIARNARVDIKAERVVIVVPCC